MQLDHLTKFYLALKPTTTTTTTKKVVRVNMSEVIIKKIDKK